MAADLEGAKEVVAKLRQAGFEAYFAGGCVRDTLRGEAPKDFDVVTDATPDEVTAMFKRTVQVGAAFGVVRVRLRDGREYEVATYRTDVGYSDGRHPDGVVYSKSKEEDVERRDFTINALLMDPFTNEVIDLVGGREDLSRRLIRAVGDPEARFGEDKLRMLRAVRFAARFGFEIEPATRAAIEKHASEIRVVSAERIVVELEGIWSSRAPGLGLRLLAETGLLAHVLPELSPAHLPLFEARLARLPDHLEKRARIDIAWAALFEPYPQLDLEARLYALKMAKTDIRLIQRLIKTKIDTEADRVRLAIDPEFPIFRAYYAVLGLPDAPWASIVEELAKDPLPPLPVLTGHDLMKAGLKQGPQFKEILAALEIEVFERRIRSKEEALAWLAKRV